MINRYTGRTLTLEIALWAVAAVFLLPLFALVNLSLKATAQPDRRVRHPGQYSVENFGRAWETATWVPL